MIERLLAGEAALARDELDAAERLFQQVATADPRNAIALVGLAKIAVRRGDRDEARALAVRALAIDPEEAAAARLLAELGRSVAAAFEPLKIPDPEALLDDARTTEPPPRPARVSWRRLLDRLLRRG